MLVTPATSAVLLLAASTNALRVSTAGSVSSLQRPFATCRTTSIVAFGGKNDGNRSPKKPRTTKVVKKPSDEKPQKGLFSVSLLAYLDAVPKIYLAACVPSSWNPKRQQRRQRRQLSQLHRRHPEAGSHSLPLGARPRHRRLPQQSPKRAPPPLRLLHSLPLARRRHRRLPPRRSHLLRRRRLSRYSAASLCQRCPKCPSPRRRHRRLPPRPSHLLRRRRLSRYSAASPCQRCPKCPSPRRHRPRQLRAASQCRRSRALSRRRRKWWWCARHLAMPRCGMPS